MLFFTFSPLHALCRYRLEVVVADDTTHTVVVMFNKIATELLNCSADSLIEAEYEAGKFLCKTCNRTVDYFVLRYRLEVVVADDTTHTVVVLFNKIATELLNCSADSLIEAEYEETIRMHPSKPNEEKSQKRYELKDSDTNEVLCSAKDPHEINDDGHVDKKKRKMCIDEDSDSV
nr:nucleic acid-binding, OB-fold protein [Tanacetum cinerariifolium]